MENGPFEDGIYQEVDEIVMSYVSFRQGNIF